MTHPSLVPKAVRSRPLQGKFDVIKFYTSADFDAKRKKSRNQARAAAPRYMCSCNMGRNQTKNIGNFSIVYYVFRFRRFLYKYEAQTDQARPCPKSMRKIGNDLYFESGRFCLIRAHAPH